MASMKINYGQNVYDKKEINGIKNFKKSIKWV